MKARLLEVMEGNRQQTREIPMSGDQFLIGRGSDCDLRLHSHEISRHHCLINIRGKEVTISDLGSSNGTFVNANRVVSQMRLVTGDEVLVGPCRFFFDMGDQPGWSPFKNVDSLAQTFQIPPEELKRRIQEQEEKDKEKGK